VGFVGRDSGVGGYLHGWSSLWRSEFCVSEETSITADCQGHAIPSPIEMRRRQGPGAVASSFGTSLAAPCQRLGGEEGREYVGEGDERSLFVFGVEGHLDRW